MTGSGNAWRLREGLRSQPPQQIADLGEVALHAAGAAGVVLSDRGDPLLARLRHRLPLHPARRKSPANSVEDARRICHPGRLKVRAPGWQRAV